MWSTDTMCKERAARVRKDLLVSKAIIVAGVWLVII